MRIDIKHIAKYLISCALLCSALVLHARDFEVGERLYFNGTPPSFNTWKNNAELWVQLKNGGSDWWLQAQWKGDIPYIAINSDCARDWTHVVLARCEPGNRYKVYNKTGDISLHSYLNYIHDFAKGDGWKDANWGTYIPAPEGNPSAWSYEDEEICTSAAGSKYELTPINREYTDKTQNSSWFEYNGSSWKNLHGTNVWTQPGERNYKITLGAAGYDKYFFFQCSTPSKCRLIRIRLNQDCSPGAPGACKITSFIAVASDANVTDSTCAVDGLVAFDDKVNAGDLKIWCDDVDTVIFANGSVKTPQTFKLKGFDAKATKSYTLHAKFLNGNSECEDVCYVIVSPPSVEPTIWNNTRTGAEGSHDRDLIRFTCEDVTLTPRNQDSKYFQWSNSDDDTKITGAKPENRNITFTAPTEEKDIEYVFMATNEPPAPEGNLISNGTFEDPDKDAYLESNYNRWGRGNTDFYTGGNAGKSGGYAITDNAKTFWHDYQDITAHEGTYFGLFDSKIYDGTEQAAWIARSGPKNPNLKVQKGVSYLFSFWVANINAYDQMNNGARLQFQISYNDGSTWTNLGDEINLKNFKDHNWHGRSSIATPDETSENVVIRVINLNQSDQNIGNDFALDDIRFEAVTSHSSNIAAYERFPVKYLKCEITGATFEQPLSCDVTKADVNYTITFVHPRGDLYIFEKNADETLTPLAHILHSDIGDETTSYTGVLKDQPVDNKNHDLIVYFDDGNVCSKDPKSYSYYSHATPTISIESLTWGTVSCDIPTVSLTAVINYTNQNGTLTAKADGIDANPAPIYTSIESDTPDQVTLTFPGLTADGKTDHKLFVNFDGAHGCSINYDIPEHAPYMPKIISTAAEVQPYKCGDEKYKVKITVNYTNSQDSDLVITDEAGNEKILKATDPEYGTTSASWIFDMPWEYPVSEHTFKAFFVGAKQCKDEPSHLCTYTAPAKPTISAVSSFEGMECDKTTYTLQLDLTYTNQKGTKFYASVDGGTPVEVANPNPGVQTEKSDVTLNITGLLADGKKDHTYRVWTDNTDDCELNITYEAPFAPVISNIEATPKQMACDITKYDVVVTFDVTNGQDSMVTVWGKEQSKTFVAVEGKNTVTFEGIETDTEKDYFDIWFENANNCDHKRTIEYEEPVTPHIELTNGPAIGETACDKTTYTVKCDVTHINQNGKLFAWIDSNSKQEFSYDKNPVTIAFTDLPGDGLEHTFNIEFDGEHSCNLTQDFKAPFAPTISNVTATPAQMGCDITKYNVTVDFVVTNGQSKEVTVQGKGQTKTFTANEGDNSVTFEEIDTNTDDDFFEVWFEEAENATDKCKKKVSYTEPVTPTIYVPDAEFNTPSCTDVTTTLTFDLEYTYQQGKLYYNVDGLPDSIKDITPNSSLITLTGLKYEGVPADGKNDHVLNIVFDGENSCRESFGLQRAPFAPVIKGVVVGEPKYKCGDDKYEIELTISYANGLNRTIYINEGSTELAPITTDNDADSHTAEPVVLKLDFDAAHHLNVFFDGYKTACPNAINIPSVAKPSLGTIKVNNATPCDGTTFDVEVEVQNFVNQDGTLTISIDEETVTSTDFTTNSATPQTKAITISGLKADISNTSHSLNVAFVGGSHGCSYSETIDIPVNPKLIGDTTAYYCFGTSFEWHGVDYKASDPAPTHTYTSNVTGCDSIVTLRLTELPELTGDTTVTITKGSTFPWHGGNYNEANTPVTHTYTSKVAPYCDSIVTLHVHEVEALVGDTTAFYCYGEAFEWYGVNYHVGDNPTHKYTSMVPPYLDSIVTLVLIERPNLATDTAASYCYGGHFEWYGAAYTIHDTPPTKIFTSTQFPECDSIVTLRLTELPLLTGDTTVTITKGSTFPWHGGNYNEANTPATHTYTSKVAPYCDSIVTLHVHEVEALVGDTTAFYCYGEAFEWYGVNYHVGDNPTHKYTSMVPPYLDSIVTLVLIERPNLATDTAASYCYGGHFEWYGTAYTIHDTPPTKIFTSTQFPECDSIVTLRLTELPELTGDTTVTITKGSTFPWHGGNYNEANTPATHTYTSKVAPYCDSIVTLHVHEVEALIGDTTAYYCYGEAFEWYGVNYHVGDNPTHKYTSMVPPYLDSIVTLVLIERPNLATDTAAYYCNGGHFEWYGTAYTIHDTPPTKIFTSTQFPECDSIVTLRLTELPLLIGDTTVTITKGSTFPWHGGNYNEANTPATHTYTSKVAPYCDSIVTLHVHEVEALIGDTTAYYCYGEAFEWYGVNYHVGDNPTHKYTSMVPPYLDSIVTLVLIERPNLATDTAASYCNGGHFEWYGTAYTIHDTPPTKIFTSTQFPECDSIVTLRLTELPLLIGDTTVTITKGSTFPWHGGNYTEANTPATHTYTSKVAPYCDSIVTLHVHEVEALVGDTTAYYCYGEAFEWYGVNYHVGDNPTHKYTSMVPPYLDSIVTLVLIERPNLATDTAASYCNGGHFEWYGTAYTIHDTPPTKIFTSTQFPECDSIVTLRLTELPLLIGDTTVTITKGSTFPWHGGNYNEDDTPTHTYTSKVAPYCDSIVTLHVHEVEALVGDTTAYYCYGEAFEWYGVNYHVGDNPTHKYTSMVPPYLDSIVTLVLIERPNLATDTAASYCYGGHFEWYGTAYTIHDTPPIKTFTSTQFPECDSIVTLRLTEIHLTATASVLPYACGDRTYSVNVEVEFANGQGRDLIIEDWKGNIAQIPTTSTDTKKEYTFTYEKHTPGGRHGYEVYLDGNADCAVYAYYIEPAQPKIDNIQHSATDVTDCNSNVYDLIVTFDYYNQDGTLSVDLDGRPADDITPAFVPDVFDKQTAKATFIGLTADGLEHTLTVKTIGGTHNCQKSIAVNAPERLSCIKDYAQTCEGEIYTWPRTGLDYGPFTHAGIDTIVNTLNVLDTLIVSVHPTYNMPAEEVSIIDGETYTWHGEDYEIAGAYSKRLETVNKCDSVVTLNLTVKENIVENVAFSIAEQCAGEGALEIAIQHTGYLTDARLSFSEDAIRAGFENGTYPIEDDIVTIPYNVKAGIFSVDIELWFHSRLKYSGNEPFTLLFPSTVLEQGWMDAIFVLTHDYNGGYDFTDFQWYKKGQKLVGETGPYLYQPLEVGAEYSAMLTEKSGLQLMTCPLIITEHTDISLYPTIVTRKQMICVSVTQNAHLTMYSLMGEKVSTYSLVHGDTQISAPSTQGIYLVEVVLESGQREVIKIMVR